MAGHPPPGTAPHHPRGKQPPQGIRHGPAPRGAHSPKPGRGEPGPDRHPPKARQTEQGTGAGHAEGHRPRGTALPAPSAGTARGAHATPPREGGTRRRGSASAHTHEGHAGTTRRAPDRARGTHRPRGMAYQRARVRDSRTGRPATRSAGHAGREGGNGRDTTPGTGPFRRTGHERRAHTDGALHPPRQ